MKRSFALWLALLAARGDGPGPTGMTPPPGDGPLIWLNPDATTPPAGIAQLAQRLRRGHPALRFVVTTDAPAADGFPRGTLLLPSLPDRLVPLRRFLDTMRPDVAVLAGAALPAALIHETHARGVPLILADARFTLADWRRWRWRSGLATALLSRCAAILAQDADSDRRLRRLGGQNLPIEVTGPIDETSDPLPCNEAEREALAALLKSRPVWLAAACRPEDEEAVLAAHARAIQLAHRMLLILAPAAPEDGPRLANRIAADGWEVALRSREEEPEEQVQVFIADTEGEMGLWYRLAPVTFMGGTLHPTTCGRSPFEPAALGSAILYGPQEAPQEAAYARLAGAKAARRVSGEAELAEALVDLIAADKAATLAHNAWVVTSGGAGAAEAAARHILAALDRKTARGAA
ncbi:3-deoxy-D-manno-octulosonic acid transferase [Frigidibacter oleivorans]|uniref:3-deoxy-D-manno-octulosonic acid transferase n=1 Tax=Frigidibacter oleivorans TaxID=2487129 RepID=UPI000F8EE83E|nr:glycosyltransferase N-terminal domain-containing protein [Frigidibacter oleivorans]